MSSFPRDSVQGVKAFGQEEGNTTHSHQKIKPLAVFTKSVPELLDQVRECSYEPSPLCLSEVRLYEGEQT